ncbi:hypothetical protein EF847_07365 [Actinobacteria bacterium YIM 96077]|uniref:Uncharacterized protein n=1 Tax=Phytoactinopolyspora halophila TaxID=1981511 RepID=A0A329QJD6_9ACTN|nr:hypothetical protein EF847_07365 [Actinobacteria bacterium YIM 96077]RAW12547.1 hypothetical protein DPM12_14220 [Phytoactinopolyspora halophila]
MLAAIHAEYAPKFSVAEGPAKGLVDLGAVSGGVAVDAFDVDPQQDVDGVIRPLRDLRGVGVGVEPG